jgi:hypothetical protein
MPVGRRVQSGVTREIRVFKFGPGAVRPAVFDGRRRASAVSLAIQRLRRKFVDGSISVHALRVTAGVRIGAVHPADVRIGAVTAPRFAPMMA